MTIVCAGGGGVGKTTSSAALAVALARTGKKTLIVTVDPARRLAHAMGVEVTEEIQPAHVEPAVEGKLFALMPEPRRSTPTFAKVLYEGRPDDLARVMKNPVYLTMADAAAGMHEIVSLILVAKAVDEGDYDYLVIDTAPSRNALDFVSYPGRLAVLFEGRAVAWLGNLASNVAQRSPEENDRGPGLFASMEKRVEAMFGRILNPRVLKDLAQLFADLALIKDRFARFARMSERMLLGERTRYLLVSAPTGSAQADVSFLGKRLARLNHEPTALLLNRSDEREPEWIAALRAEAPGWPPLAEAMSQVEHEFQVRKRAGDRLSAALGKELARVPQVRLPTLESPDPAQIVRELATKLEPHLATLVRPIG
ncbi:Arsenical pump-driving ATPase [Sandaracinus amylolyticus]|uniref:arsenite-transporting ATPase n=1 Tax=Sandaracinus amylolyticus TaxID=927083 RepID=A0A0F6YIP7_9BACT|nr:Arsenical pump-driving ATPase [Sandaracinus amylolyticus]